MKIIVTNKTQNSKLKLKKFGDYFFDGNQVIVNLKPPKKTNQFGDPYENVLDYVGIGIKIAKELSKFEIKTLELDLTDSNEASKLYLGLQLGSWEYSQTNEDLIPLKTVTKLTKEQALELDKLVDSINFARNFLMLPPEFDPNYFVETIQSQFKSTDAKIEVFGQKQMEEMQLDACLKVNQGAKKEPKFVKIHIPATKSTSQNLVIVGKCLYDVGGLAIKDAPGQRLMYIDKGGAATALGIAKYFAANNQLEDTNLTFYIPAVRNEVSDSSYYNGEVINVASCNPKLTKKVEIGNTDAEGRLTLADAVALAQVEYSKPDIISLATLTGASMRSHGTDCASLFANNPKQKQSLEDSFVKESEFAEVFPFRQRMESWFKDKKGVADISNIPNKSGAGHQSAAEFVRKFAGEAKFIHCDIAGPVVDGDGQATGYGIRSLIKYIQSNY